MSARFDESHPALEGFSDLYDREIGPWLAERDGQRKTAVRNALLFVALTSPVAAVLVLSGLGMHNLLGQTGQFGVFAGAGIAIGSAFLSWRWVQSVKDDVKAFLMSKICDFLGLQFFLAPSNAGLESFRHLSLIPSYDDASLEDEISGTYEGVGLRVFEADLVKETRDADGDTDRSRVFRGLLMRFTFPKLFQGTTIVTQDRGWLGNFFSKLGTPGEKISLEDPRFEKMFEVYGNNQVEARYLLTPAFMERILALSHQIGKGKLRLAFHGEMLLISLRTDSDQFEAGSMFSRLDDPKRVQDILDELAILFRIVETLNLTTKTRA